jgi:hypothetical protein
MRSRVRYLTLYHGHTLPRIVCFALLLKGRPHAITPTLRELSDGTGGRSSTATGSPERLTTAMNNNIVIFDYLVKYDFLH